MLYIKQTWFIITTGFSFKVNDEHQKTLDKTAGPHGQANS